jgi:hypothetical protein
VRLVEMQLNHAAAPDADIDWMAPDSGGEGPSSKTIREFETRRCLVCPGHYPPFGIGPPVTRPGQTICACVTHRAEIDRVRTQRQATTVGHAQPSLI